MNVISKCAALLFLPILVLTACRLGPSTIVIPDNIPPPFNGVSQLLVKNYVNKLFIDLLGREAFDSEISRLVDQLNQHDLSTEIRDSIIHDIQLNEEYLEGDSSYRWAYIQRIYDQSKIQLLDGVSDDQIRFDIWQLEQKIYEDSLRGDISSQVFAKREIAKLKAVLQSKEELFHSEIGIGEVYRRMIYNEVYDRINMGSYNFINAAFQDLFFRFPTEDEFYQIFPIVEFNQPGIIFGIACENKEDLIQVMVSSREFHEQIIRKSYRSLISREPSTEEVSEYMTSFFQDQDYHRVLREVMKLDEYANF